MKTEFIVLNERRNVTLTAYILDAGGEFKNIPKRPAVLILPGGGYAFCSDREADPAAMPYLQAGYHAFILRYSVKEHKTWPNPLDDYEQAITTIRSRAGEWNVYADKIAVVGFSAGGHLAGAAAVMSDNRPDAAILGYAAVSGVTIKMCSATAPDIIGAVDNKTCPCFVFTTVDDNVVPAKNSIAFIEALDNCGVAYESHFYAYGPHGISTGDKSVMAPDARLCERAPRWVGDSIGWLRDMFGDFGQGRMTEPRCPARLNDDGGAYLSVDCTLAHALKFEKAAKILEPVVKTGIKAANFGDGVDAMGFLSHFKLRDVFAFADMPKTAMDVIDAQLKKIKTNR